MYLQTLFQMFFELPLGLGYRTIKACYSTSRGPCRDCSQGYYSNIILSLILFLLQVFDKDGQDYFVDMMPALHNYITIDTEAFLTSGSTAREYPTMVFNICKKILLESDPGKDDDIESKFYRTFFPHAERFYYTVGPWRGLTLMN